MFDMSIPWWEFIVRAGAVYIVLLVMIRITGKRTVGQFTPFDLVVVLLLSEAVSGAINAQDESLSGGIIAAATLIALDFAIGVASSRSKRLDAVLQGNPVLVGRDGVIYDEVLRRQNREIEDMRMAILEADGNINVLKKHP